MSNFNKQFLKFSKEYKIALKKVIKENKFTDLFDQVDEALKRVKERKDPKERKLKERKR